MNKRLMTFAAVALLAGARALAATPSPAPAEHGSEAEAMDMVKKAVAQIKANPEAAHKAITEHPNGAFKDRDLYVFVYDFDGNSWRRARIPRWSARTSST